MVGSKAFHSWCCEMGCSSLLAENRPWQSWKKLSSQLEVPVIEGPSHLNPSPVRDNRGKKNQWLEVERASEARAEILACSKKAPGSMLGEPSFQKARSRLKLKY